MNNNHFFLKKKEHKSTNGGGLGEVCSALRRRRDRLRLEPFIIFFKKNQSITHLIIKLNFVSKKKNILRVHEKLNAMQFHLDAKVVLCVELQWMQHLPFEFQLSKKITKKQVRKPLSK